MDAMDPQGLTEAPILDEPNYDRFFLRHLQVINGTEGRYRNHKHLGLGGNGTAFLVTCCDGPRAGTQMVLKVFHKISNTTRRKAFLKEVNTLRLLDHPSIVRIFDEGTFHAQERVYPFAVIEYMPTTLRAILKGKPLNRLHAMLITLNCLGALTHLHEREKPLIHRDIKPDNIMVGEAGAKLADFGLVKELEDITATAVTVGHPMESTADLQDLEEDEVVSDIGTQWPGMPRYYRSYELIERAHNRKVRITPASDILQLGSVFYEMLTGKNPQKSVTNIDDPLELDIRSIKGDSGSALLDLINHMHAARPVDRPTARQCLERLDWLYRSQCEQAANLFGTEY